MAINCYLAMTAAEIRNNPAIPPYCGWMACHFSPYGTGLSNLPRELPEGAMLILNDRIPICGHDQDTILNQLSETASQLKCSSILLDFQRPDCPETAALTKLLLPELPCPAAVSQLYAVEDTPVFLPPAPLDTPLSEYLAPWSGREIWLEAALDSLCLRLTSDGCTAEPSEQCEESALPHRSDTLHSHYRIDLADDCVKFYLQRTKDDLAALLEEAAKYGVTRAVGLFQELEETFLTGK